MLNLKENDLTYLIISCDKISYRMESSSSREFTRANHGFKFQLLLAVAQLGRFCLGYLRWNCPVIHGDISFFTQLFVGFVMLSDVEAVRGIASFVESLSHSILFDEFYVISTSK